MSTRLKNTFKYLFIGNLIILIISGFIDLPLSLALFNPSSWFGNFFAVYGALPVLLCLYFISLVLFNNVKQTINESIKVLNLVFGVLVLCVGLYVSWYLGVHTIDMNPLVSGVITSVLFLGVVYLSNQYIFLNGDIITIRKVAFVLGLSVIATVLIVIVIKVAWGRPRMRLLASEDNINLFRNWWEIGTSLKNEMTIAGIAAEEFKSFPSGHTADAALMLFLPVISIMNEKLKDKERTFIIVGIVWTVFVAISRIIIGAHFISDVTVSFLITLLIVYAGFTYLYKKG
jgi:membrane-associated phospholipid phosphatase